MNKYPKNLQRFYFILWIGLLLASIAFSKTDNLEEKETWTSADGRSIKAELVDFNQDQNEVTLLRADGLKFTIELDGLSKEDQQQLLATIETVNNPFISNTSETAPEKAKLPEKFILKGVPMIKQRSNYCVPASAAMISGFHGIKTDQEEIAQLSSEGSANNEGTYPRDMLLAMQKLGFKGKTRYWRDEETFTKTVLPSIREALIDSGPIYVSFKPDVFGSMGHGCVIIGYSDRKEELYFHNPWGNKFEKDYDVVAQEAGGVVFIDAPTTAPIASDAFIKTIQQALTTLPESIMEASSTLQSHNIPFKIVWCNRKDERDNKQFAKNTARRDGRKILDLAFSRSSAILIPSSPKGITQTYLLVTRPEDGGADFPVRELSTDGWTAKEDRNLGQLTREWTTYFETLDGSSSVWELPMIELSMP